MPRVLIVPGLAVRDYVDPARQALVSRGLDTQVLLAPGQQGSDTDLDRYAQGLARRLADEQPLVLVGLSVGAQAAALTAAATPAVGSVSRLVLVSPTVDPGCRSMIRLVSRWGAGARLEPPRLARSQVPEWRRAGVRRVGAVLRSALRVRLEAVLPRVVAPVTVVHAERDTITSHAYAAGLAAGVGGTFVVVPGATHSWPFGDEARFADVIQELP